MANVKISNLTAATTPVAGTEVLPIVQSGATVKVSIANLTPGLDTITAAKGGTGQTSYAVGDLLYASTTTALSKLADVATGNALISGGVSTAPSWGKIGLTTHVSGTLPTANGGTNLTSFTANGVVYASSSSALTTGSGLVFDGTNLGIGTAPSVPLHVQASSGALAVRVKGRSSDGYGDISFYNNANTVNYAFVGASSTGSFLGTGTTIPLQFYINNAEVGRFDASGNLLVGTTTAGAGAGFPTKLVIDAGSGDSSIFKTSSSTNAIPLRAWNAGTTGDNFFINFATETSYTSRGSITYNRTGGLIVYGTTSDYRAKDISGPVINSGALIDSVPVYMGTMKGATQERPMFIAHETPVYAHTGEKDAVDKDGNPIYQQMDVSALVPVMWAEIQSLRKRLAALESA